MYPLHSRPARSLRTPPPPPRRRACAYPLRHSAYPSSASCVPPPPPCIGQGLAGAKVPVGGWVKTGRKQGKGSFSFLEINDGSYPGNLQVIVYAFMGLLAPLIATGTSVLVEGELKKPPEGRKQKVELQVERVRRDSLAFLQDVVHLQSRTNIVII